MRIYRVYGGLGRMANHYRVMMDVLAETEDKAASMARGAFISFLNKELKGNPILGKMVNIDEVRPMPLTIARSLNEEFVSKVGEDWEAK